MSPSFLFRRLFWRRLARALAFALRLHLGITRLPKRSVMPMPITELSKDRITEDMEETQKSVLSVRLACLL